MITILPSRINSSNKFRLKNNNPELAQPSITLVQDDFIKTSEPAFKGKIKLQSSNLSIGKKVVTALAGLLGVKTVLDKQENIKLFNKKEWQESNQKLLDIYNKTFDPINPEDINLLTNEYLENPTLVEGLATRTYQESLDQDSITQAAFSPKDIVLIAQTYKEDRMLAYKLAQTLEKKGGSYSRCSDLQRDYLLEKLNENPKLVEHFSKDSMNPVDTVKLLVSYEYLPELTLDIHKTKKYSASETAELIHIAKENYDTVKDLALHKDIIFYPKTTKAIAKSFYKDIKIIDEYANFIKYYEIERNGINQDEILLNTLNSYKLNQNLTEDLLISKWALKDINAAVKAHTDAPDFIRSKFRKDIMSKNFCKNYSATEALNLVEYVNNNLEYYKNLEQGIEAKTNTNDSIKLIRLINRSKNSVERIIKDGRGKSVEDIEALLDVYQKNPNIKITDDIIRDHKNSLRKLFEL